MANKFPNAQDFRGASCLFCGTSLSNLDACYCRGKRLCMVWVKEDPRGACSACLTTALTIQRRCYVGTWLSTKDLENHAGKCQKKILARCYYCGTPLLTPEHHRHLLDDEPYWYARQRYWGRCADCANDGSRPCHCPGFPTSSSTAVSSAAATPNN